jgi:hypothetical protein
MRRSILEIYTWTDGNAVAYYTMIPGLHDRNTTDILFKNSNDANKYLDLLTETFGLVYCTMSNHLSSLTVWL